MEVVPTSDGDDDDGVIWFRCPRCQGFLPKLSGGGGAADQADVESETNEAVVGVGKDTDGGSVPATAAGDSPFLPEDESEEEKPATGGAPDDPADGLTDGEPIAAYAALLQAADVSEPTPYRPWGEYSQGQCLHHLAWDDCGVVVAKEELPGGRSVIKCYFEKAGVVRLIEQEPR